MPRYYCDYCDTYLTHDSPSVRKQHNAGYKHKANVRIYYQQYEAQQNQYLIDLKVKEHLGQAAAFQVGAAYNQLRPRLPVLPTPMMPMPGNPMMSIPGMRPLAPLPRPIPGYPGMPPMVAPPGAPSMPGQVNNGVPRPLTVSAPMMAPGSSGTPTSGAPPPMFTPTMYQANPTASAPGGFESPNASAQPQETNH
ncbi:putative U1 small nuclear ribonucleoprotein C [Helianthus annuus]|uniref:U1 small nuclear ribonucleoprotein C n=1 Tax=Helianthus annuus TaxID=4232 RepID=A0A251T942_HELAN|nr:U1 small nuclear ribonucleoprotein C [Helianthus annuus]XP_021993032.1 U1 small nuclear ribonucleoprotein C [Helianthus annuus]KAF5782556.1 putative U1 small nuclear ribonucleoprotein C [Helianthus annuus]KAJ0502031.1 putative U1 small nuclear ribonucleoprotein C [Helianthus annuus]KAJ0509987.1 putative U1 small nuclear ribonucleoprotein C [Helianthus annuus]KAJ0517955.1 putative U1 small nuclear ribonucleoprotein C [Helianthus annuus]KAJ0685975.1 putative U1 small nuclear ribonucleoprotei